MAAGKTALVLSAGGMFGAYQAGAWKAMEHAVRPDLVVGASIGALNGWLIAADYGGNELCERWLHPSAGKALSVRQRKGWFQATPWFDGAPLQIEAERLAAQAQPQIPFGLVMLRLSDMRAVLVQHPQVTAAHLQATCSIPLLLPSVKIAGTRYVDGGFLEKLPIWAAVRMGATRVIAIDCLPRTGPWWLRAGMRGARMFAPARHIPAHVGVTIIEPSEPLGAAQDAVCWKRENIARWIALGERDAIAQALDRQIA